MARLSQTFELNDLPENEYGLLKDGNYAAFIEQADVKITSKGDGHYIKLMLQVMGPTNKGAKLFHNINISLPSSPEAERIGRQQLRQLMEAIGLMRLSDTDELIGKQVLCKVGTHPATDKYDASNVIKKFSKLEGVAQASRPMDTEPAHVTKPAGRPW